MSLSCSSLHNVWPRFIPIIKNNKFTFWKHSRFALSLTRLSLHIKKFKLTSSLFWCTTPSPNLKWPYLGTKHPFEKSQRTDLKTTRDRQITLVFLLCIWPIRHHMTNDWKWSGGFSLANHKTKNKCLISANTNADRQTMHSVQRC